MKFAYADPPYPGQAKRLYGDHPDYAGEVDHGELIERLCGNYDGWALSTNAVSLQFVLALCPLDVRVAAWIVTNQPPPGGATGWWYCWEPVIVRGGRPGPVRNILQCPNLNIIGGQKFVGSKPPAFTRWMLGLLGAMPEDEIDDLFPGSGAVLAAIEGWRRQPVLPGLGGSFGHQNGHRRQLERDMRLRGHLTLEI